MSVEKKNFWKGKRVTKKLYDDRIKRQQVGKNLRQVYGKKHDKNDKEKKVNNIEVEGRRIVHVETLAKELFYCGCGEVISLVDTVMEKQLFLLDSLLYFQLNAGSA